MTRLSLLDHFSAWADPRQNGKVLYSLPEIMLLILCGTRAGAQDLVEIRESGGRKLGFLRSLRPFTQGIRYHDTLNDVRNALPGGLFTEVFAAWVEGLRADPPDIAAPDIVAVDGKTSRRAHRGALDPLHVVSAWARRQRPVPGQEATDAKYNEISAIPVILERLQLTGALVPIAAIGPWDQDRRGDPRTGCRLSSGAERQPAQPCRGDSPMVRGPEAATLPVHEATGADHGRIETPPQGPP